MKRFFVLVVMGAAFSAAAQNGDELLVYSLKGNVTVIENNQESKARIGKILKPGASIRAQRLSKLTMVCKQGKPLTVIKEGTYPVLRWKDSCETDHHSVSSKYFQFIWDQLYVRSDEYKKKHPDAVGAVPRDDAPVRGQEELELVTPQGLDTLHYAGTNFTLSWNSNLEYSGKYYFKLVNTKTGKTVYQDSVTRPRMELSAIRKYLKTGNDYSWSVSISQAISAEGGILRSWPSPKSGQVVRRMQRLVSVPEDVAAANFRTAYLLENEHWPGEARVYYQKAVKAAPGEEFYQEQLKDFEIRFGLRKGDR